MERLPVPAVREDWKAKVVQEGMLWGMTEDGPYWFEAMEKPVYYNFKKSETDELKLAGEMIHACVLEVLTSLTGTKEGAYQDKWLKAFGISPEIWEVIKNSFWNDEWEFYGRFDFLMTANGPKMLEYNADTPTILIESAVCQWNWFEEMGFKTGSQFNHIHEALVNRWRELRDLNELSGKVNFTSVDLVDDVATLGYLAETCKEAGLDVNMFPMGAIGFDSDKQVFVDLDGQPIENCFKLYPWEWMIHEEFGKNLKAPTRWIEPAWKLLVSNKALLALLWDYYGATSHPVVKYLMPAYLAEDFQKQNGCWVSKPTLSREGSDVCIMNITDGNTEVVFEHTGMYHDETRVYQKFIESLRFDGCTPMLGVWMVGPEAVGLGIREDDTLVTQNNSRFIPHVIE